MDNRLDQTCLIVDFAYSGCERREINTLAYLDISSITPAINTKIANEDPLEACLAFYIHTDTFNLTSGDFDIFYGQKLTIFQWEEIFTIDLED